MTDTHAPAPWSLHIERYVKGLNPGGTVRTLTGNSHYGSDYLAILDANGEVVCDNADYYATAPNDRDFPLIAQAPHLFRYLREARAALDETLNDSLCKDIDRVLAAVEGAA